MNGSALKYQSEYYPAGWHGKVPKRVRALTQVHSDIDPSIHTRIDEEYEVWVNTHGAVAALVNGRTLGLKPNDFEIIDWHATESSGEAAPTSTVGDRP